MICKRLWDPMYIHVVYVNQRTRKEVVIRATMLEVTPKIGWYFRMHRQKVKTHIAYLPLLWLCEDVYVFENMD